MNDSAVLTVQFVLAWFNIPVIAEEQGQLHAEVHIKSAAACVPRFCEHGSHPVLRIVVDTKHNFEAALGQVFGQVSDVCVWTMCLCWLFIIIIIVVQISRVFLSFWGSKHFMIALDYAQLHQQQ